MFGRNTKNDLAPQSDQTDTLDMAQAEPTVEVTRRGLLLGLTGTFALAACGNPESSTNSNPNASATATKGIEPTAPTPAGTVAPNITPRASASESANKTGELLVRQLGVVDRASLAKIQKDPKAIREAFRLLPKYIPDNSPQTLVETFAYMNMGLIHAGLTRDEVLAANTQTAYRTYVAAFNQPAFDSLYGNGMLSPGMEQRHLFAADRQFGMALYKDPDYLMKAAVSDISVISGSVASGNLEVTYNQTLSDNIGGSRASQSIKEFVALNASERVSATFALKNGSWIASKMSANITSNK